MLRSAEDVIARELRRGEKLLWAGQPRGGIRLRGTDAFLIPFSILWTGFAVAWEATVLWSGAPLVFALFGIPFVLVGLYFVFGRFLVDAKQRAKTFYGLTEERAIIVSGLLTRKCKSLDLRTAADISLTERKDGSGTISFGPVHTVFAWFGADGSGGWPGMEAYAPPGFAMIDRARGVYDLILATKHDAK
jgi:hypothetical protein